MAENHLTYLLGVMDRLWFHQVILFSESTALLVPKTLKPQQLSIESLAYPSSSSSCLSLESPLDEEISLTVDEEISLTASSARDGEISSGSPPNSLLDDSNNEVEQKEDDKYIKQRERPTRANLITRRARSHSSSPSTEKRPKKIKHSIAGRQRLQKSVSCRSMGELELEEVKGFMDLGFIFKEENLSPRMMSVVPGLQRLRLYKNKHNINVKGGEVAEEDKQKEEKEEEGITRPYLSEAWLIKRPDSPLLNLRIPRVTAAADMKKHLRFWARTVASVIDQES